MTDETAPAESGQAIEETPEQTEPGQVSEQSTIPDDPEQLASSYRELQKTFTQRSQEWAEKERQLEQAEQHSRFVSALLDPETQADALRALGLEIEDDGPDPDEIPDPDERISRVEQMLQTQQQEARMAELQEREDEFIAERIDALEDQENTEFTDREVDIIYNLARSSFRDPRTGEPNVADAYAALKEAWGERQKAWQQSKSAPRAPGSGVPASKKFDLSTEEGRLAAQVAAAERFAASQ